MKERILDDVPAERLPPSWKFPDVRSALSERGVPVLSGGDVTTPIELLCGARSFFEFFIDLAEIPDVVEAAMEAIVPHLTARTVRAAEQRGYPAVWVGGWHGAPCLLSPEMWRRFVWRYFSRVVHEVVDSGSIAVLHLDSGWTGELSHFRELPRGRCILALDGTTDIFEAKSVLGDHLCVMGDVPATMTFRIDSLAEQIWTDEHPLPLTLSRAFLDSDILDSMTSVSCTASQRPIRTRQL